MLRPQKRSKDPNSLHGWPYGTGSSQGRERWRSPTRWLESPSQGAPVICNLKLESPIQDPPAICIYMAICNVHAYQLVVLVDRVIDVDHHELASQAGEGHQHPKGDTVHTGFKLVYIHVH